MSHGGQHQRVPGLDGLRGLAVGGVLAFHLGYGWARGGYLGVSAFFTLSGFLITSLLLAERARTGRIDLAAFWARRARRLLPAALAALAGIVAFAATVASPSQLASLRADGLAALGYVANWRFVSAGRSYEALWSAPSPVQHFWSLAIEEQFYVAFPLVAAAALVVAKGRRAALGAVLAAAAVASVAAGVALEAAGAASGRLYYGTDVRAVELAVGGLLAVATGGRIAAGRTRRWVDAAGWGALAALLAAWATVGQDDGRLFRGGLALHAVAVAAVVAAARGEGSLAHVLSVRPLRWLGRVSYGAYLYHWPVFLWLTPQRVGAAGVPLAALRLAVTMALATASHRWLEEPIRTGRRLRPAPARAASAAAAAAVVAGLVVSTAAPPGPTVAIASGARAPVLDADARASLAAARREAPRSLPAVSDGVVPHAAFAAAASPTTAPQPPAPARIALGAGERPRVLMIGDSNVLVIGQQLQHRTALTRTMHVWASGWFACHVVRGGTYRYAGVPKDTDPKCNGWATSRAAEVQELRPHVTLVGFGSFDVLDRRLPGSDRWSHIGEPEYDALVRSEIAAMTDMLRALGTRVVWWTYPAVNIGTVDGVPPLRPHPESDPRRIERWNLLVREVAAARPDVGIVDLRGYMQSRPGGELDPTRRPDGLHPTEAFAAEIAGWLEPQLLQAARTP